MDFEPSARSAEMLGRLRAFMHEHVLPFESVYFEANRQLNPGGDWQRWQLVPGVEERKQAAREAGLWNLFLPDPELGQGLSTLDYAPLAEEMGRCLFAAELFNCSAPDTGNMEVLYHFGTARQKADWLGPLLAGEIRSVFCMTEPDVASSDATNVAARIEADGDDLVLNGRKWWATGAGHPRTRLVIFMGVSDPDGARHSRHSMVLVPLDSPGVSVVRMLRCCGDFDAPAGHGEIHFENVRVPRENFIGAAGQGFAVAQGRLGPGRIHHCMRCIGAAERVLSLAVERAASRHAFGKPVLALGGNRERIAEARLAIDQARLLTLYAAWKMDRAGIRAAMTEIAAIKVIAPRVLQQVTDLAMQLHGGAGLSDDFPLMGFFTQARALRLADGPDEVHKAAIAKLEVARQGAGT